MSTVARGLFLLAAVTAGALAQESPVLTIDLPDALSRARAYSAQFLAAGTAAALAREDRVQARATLLPSLNSLSEMIYTQPNGTPAGVFVANNGVHEYAQQAVVHAEPFSVTHFAEYRRAQAAEAAAAARQEVAARGLAATVIQSYYGLAVAERHLTNAARSADEAQNFLDITQKQEQGGEAAHADVVKAALQLEQRKRDLSDAQVAEAHARIALAVIMLPDITQRFEIVDDLKPDTPLMPMDEFRGLALNNSPDVRAAQLGVQEANHGVRAAKGVYYPSLVFDYFYGIDANNFGVFAPDGTRNLGSVVQGSITIPVWNFGANQSRVRQAEIQRRQAETDLSLARRQLQGAIAAYYVEAQTARGQIDSLRTSLDLAEESLKLTLLRYQAGEATALEVVDAQTTLAQARNGYADGLARYRLALANMQTLTGRF
jgi:outer membrane protein TolC